MTEMTPTNPKTLNDYLAREYSLDVIAQPEGGYVIEYPDLPGCMTQVDSLAEVSAAAQEIRTLWIETQFADGFRIPLPSLPEEYSGKFVLRIAKSLHRRLATSASKEGVSLNQYAMSLLDRHDALARLESKIDAMEVRSGRSSNEAPVDPPHRPRPTRRRTALAPGAERLA